MELHGLQAALEQVQPIPVEGLEGGQDGLAIHGGLVAFDVHLVLATAKRNGVEGHGKLL